MTQEKNNKEGKREQNLEKENICFLWRRRKTQKENIFVFGEENWRRKRKKICLQERRKRRKIFGKGKYLFAEEKKNGEGGK